MSAASTEANRFQIYGGHDARELPAYSVDIAARLLLLSTSTLKTWAFGGSLREKKSGQCQTFLPLIEPPDRSEHMLSFVNLVEVHVLKAFRGKRFSEMEKVGDGLARLRKSHPQVKHPLADIDLLADGRDRFVRDFGSLLNVAMGDLAIEFLAIHLNRVERNSDGSAARLFPFPAHPVKVGHRIFAEESKDIVIDPYVSFGRPTINGTGISTEAIADRFWGGDPIDMLVDDFKLTKTVIESAVRYEHAQSAFSR